MHMGKSQTSPCCPGGTLAAWQGDNVENFVVSSGGNVVLADSKPLDISIAPGAIVTENGFAVSAGARHLALAGNSSG